MIRRSILDNLVIMAQLRIGAPNEFAEFTLRHRSFFEGSDVLQSAIDAAFERELTSSDNADMVVFFLGSRCEEDFREIALLAANGHGWGATSHLRGMYERAVVSAYIHEHAEDVDRFIDFDLVRRWRAAQKIKETFNVDAEGEAQLRTLKQAYDTIVDHFRVTDCAKCGTKRINHTWHSLNFVEMARAVGQLGRMIVPAYYMPLAQAHGTLASAIYRLAEHGDGSFFVDPAASRAEAIRSLKYAHLIMLGVLTVQYERFSIPELEGSLGQAWNHYRSAWGVGPGDAAAG